MKIAWLHSHILFWMGGTKLIFEVTRRLAKNKEVVLFVQKTNKKHKKNFERTGVKVLETLGISSNNPLYWLFLPYWIKKERKILGKKLKKFDVIVVSMFPLNWVVENFDKPKVQYCFEPFSFFYDKDFLSGFWWPKRILIKFLKALYSNMDKEAVKKMDRVLTLTKITKKWIREIYGVNAKVTYAGVDTNHFRPTKNPLVEKKYKDKKVIIHSTDFSPVKGTDRLIRAFAQVGKRIPEVVLLITSTIKNPQEQGRLEELAKRLGVREKVEFLGFVDYELLPAYYSKALVFVSGSFSERAGATSMNLPVKEALACGTPAIRAPVKGEDVEDGVSGFLVDPRNISKMSARIIELLKDPKKSKRMGRKGRQKILKTYSWDKTVKIIVDEIKQASRV